MMAETHEEVMGYKDYMQVMKGKRKKRQRPQSPLTLAMVSNCSSAAESGGEGERFSDNSVVIGGLDRSIAAGASGSPTTSVQEFTTNTEEEEDMANCLILLAQGRHTKKLSAHHQPAVKSNPNIATTNNHVAAAGLYVYECKTCNRCFPSFQALGGHRASHKKPKVNNNNNEEEDDHHFGNMMNTTLSLQIANRVANLSANSNNKNNNNGKANKVHECSICGAEFSSGQALGGHMRRHRAFMSTTTTTTPTALSHCIDQAEKHPRNILQLDLNLPAPEDHVDRRESKFSFASKEQVIVFSASSLVDCHY